MIKFTAPPAFILTLLGISWCSLRSRSFERKGGNLSSGSVSGGTAGGGSGVCHAPKLTVALARRPSSAIAKGAASPMKSIATTQKIDSVECLIWSSSLRKSFKLAQLIVSRLLYGDDTVAPRRLPANPQG